jgi:hypothetical protein
MFKLITNLWEYFFNPWDIEIIEEGQEPWFQQPLGTFSEECRIRYFKSYVKYRYTHKFRKQEKIVKKYFD